MRGCISMEEITNNVTFVIKTNFGKINWGKARAIHHHAARPCTKSDNFLDIRPI